MGLITVAASLGAFIGQVPEELLDLTWTPSESASGWRRTLSELNSDDLLDVAKSSDRGVVGFVWAGPSARQSGGAGEVKGLYVLPTRQRQGIGRRLLSHAAKQLRDRSMPALFIGCIRENPSCDFYRHLGGTEAFREPSTVDRYRTEEIFFAWPDSSAIAGTR